ncbi:MAG TPA: FtsX-like permease family protein [Cyclobacteriaceae bacterium]|nr:FtsX-like permease family protein [Cyclobacteriaceae bacterium]
MTRPQPPKWITWLVERLTSHREAEVILGDMDEEYESRFASAGKFRADAGYAIDFVSLLMHRVLGNKKRTQRSSSFTMFSNYLKVALRQLARQRLHNFINITGLAVGLAVSFLISLFVVHEMSYDQFHTKGDRLYLLPMTWKFGGTQVSIVGTTAAAGPVMQEMFPEIEKYVRMTDHPMVFILDQGAVEDREVAAADSTFFEVFSFPLIAGNPKTALKQPYSLVLTEKAAIRYFGEGWKNKDLLSKTLVAQNGKPYKITGIAKDPPGESLTRFEVLLSMNSLNPSEIEPNWDRSSMTTYVLLAENASAADIVSRIPEQMRKKYGGEWLNESVEMDLVPVKDLYLRNPKYIGLGEASDIKYVYIFSAIAALVLVIAIINYMNLSTARSMERAKEVGVRKVVGAVRLELFWQFISESIFVSFIAIVGAVGIAYLMLPLFNKISGKSLVIDFTQHPGWIGVLLATWLVISLLGGAYPAAVLSSFRPAKVLKGKIGSMGSGALLRKSLVVLQFSVSIFLIVCTLTINDQLTHMVNSKIGIDKEQLITIPLDSISRRQIESLRTELAPVAGVELITSMSSNTPVSISSKSTVGGSDVGEERVMVYNVGVDPEFVKAIGLDVVSGTDFSRDVPKDTTWEFLVNESAVGFFGWTKEDAIGRRLSMWNRDGVVKGVVRDFNFAPLHKAIEPLVIHSGMNNTGYIGRLVVRIHGDDFEAITSAIEERWKKVVPSSPFSFYFVDKQYDDLYRSETTLSSIMNVFSALAIFIAGLGLFGLASYTIMQRTKELGIRKVLGANLSGLVMVVSGGFVRLVTIAFILAVPVSWLVMNNWLENFAYPVSFNWVIVIGSGAMAIAVAFSTVLYHAFEAVRVNPVNSLRSE